MAKDFAFMFYPGDYLRDTQCLSEKAQVSYDRIMCEHMRNTCITQQQLKFFTKRLNQDELDELISILTPVNDGFQIEWVVQSINKYKAYSESRAKNRVGKTSKNRDLPKKSYVPHMESESESDKGDYKRGQETEVIITKGWTQEGLDWQKKFIAGELTPDEARKGPPQ